MARGRDYTPNDYRNPATPTPAPARHQDRETLDQSGRGAGQGTAPASAETTHFPSRGAGKPRPERQTYREIDRNRPLPLRDSEIRTLAEIGTFRAVTAEDLTRFRYGSNARQAWRDLNNLARQGLVRRRTAMPEGKVYLTLTRQGHRFIEGHQPQGIDARQVLYHGFVKPRESKHDAALYRLYQEAAGRIVREGGRIHRVVLDFELKRSVYRELAKVPELPESEQSGRKREIAEEHGLTVVNGKIPLPDVRIEYETRDLEQTKVDLELATSDYHHSSLAEKSQAGFAIFALREDAAPLRRAMGDPELTKDIFSI